MLKRITVMGLLGISSMVSAQSTDADWEAQHIAQLKQTQKKVAARIAKDEDFVETAMGELALPGKETRPVIKELQGVVEQAESTPFPTKLKGFRTIIPFNDSHAKVFKAWSMILRDKGFKGLRVWHVGRFEKFPLFAVPTKKKVSTISLKMMGNERRSQVFNLTNCTKKKQDISVVLGSIPEGADIKVFYTVYVDNKKLKERPTALMVPTKTDKGWTFPLHSGMTTQVWLIVESKTAKAGVYKIPITVTMGAIKKSIQFKLIVSKVKMKTQLTHNLNMFEGIVSGDRMLKGREKGPLFKDMITHRATMFQTSRHYLPPHDRGLFDDQGNLIKEPDTTKFKEALAMLPKETRYYFFAASLRQTHGKLKFADFEPGSPACMNAFKQWVKFIEKTVVEQGVDPKKVVMFVKDEPRKNDDLKLVYDCFKIVKENTKFTTHCTIGARGAKEPYCAKAISVTDIVQPCRRHLQELYGKRLNMFLDLTKSKNQQLWIYDCGYKPLPINYILWAWQDGKWGATGTGYWAYCDAGDNPTNWNMYPQFRRSRKRMNYAPQYVDEKGVTDTREWEAITEGVENCEYMHMLKKKNANSPLLKRKLPSTLKESEKYRLEILKALEL